MRKYTFSISKPNYEVTDPDPSHKMLDADYPFFKFHDDLTNTVTINVGDTEQYVDFTHNLGYVPAFIAYGEDMNGKQRFIPAIPWGTGFTSYWYAYADSTKVRCGWSGPTYNSTVFDATEEWDDADGVNIYIWLGKKDGATRNGAVRVPNITVAQGASINLALLNFKVGSKGPDSNHLKLRTYGINEDNTSDFGSSPMGRSKTSAYTDIDVTIPSENSYFAIDVTSQVQAIVNRGGWTSGNAMGFLIYDNGSNDGVYVGDYNDQTLEIKVNGSATLTFRAVIFKDKIA